MTLREQIERLVRLIVDRPEQLSVTEVPASDATVFEVEVAEDDLGKIIGRQGRTARAFRTLLAERGAREREHYELEIVD